MGSLSLQNVKKSFGLVDVIKGIDLEVNDGEFVVFVGPSGCGKSTLLRIIAGLEDVTSGAVLIDGEDMTYTPPSKRGVAMVFQSYALYPHLSVKDNMSVGLKQAKVPAPEIEEHIDNASKMLGLDDYLKRRPSELSGGQRQRVAIGRAIVRDPKLFLFDEPLSNLDAELRVNTRLEIARLHREIGATMVYVTHDQVEAMTLADRIVVLRDGIIEQVGTPMELYNDPCNMFVGSFIGSPKMNFIDGVSVPNVKSAKIGVRPEHIEFQENGFLTGVVSHVEHLGADTICYLKCESIGIIVARMFGEIQVEVGKSQSFSFDFNKIFHFDDQGRRITTL